MQKFTLTVILFLLFACQVVAQTVDTTQVLPPNSPAGEIDSTQVISETEFESTDEKKKLPAWFYSLGVDGTISSGNVDRQLLNIKGTLNYELRKSIFGFFTSPKFQFGSNSDVLQEREIFMDLNTTLFYAQKDVYGIAFGIFEQSNLRKIILRYNAGIGIGWKILGGKKTPKSALKISISTALVKEKTDFETQLDKNIFRSSTRLKINYNIIPEKLTFNSIAFLQPSLNDDYYRWNSSSNLSYNVGKHISILISYENTYENFNSLNIKNAQSNATIGLVYSSSNK
jgi:Protein of unknown function, DUF481